MNELEAYKIYTKELRRWIFRNGEHKEGCPGAWDENCNCGLSQLLSSYRFLEILKEVDIK